jgi:uncharacterized damage-inducible protein DinB
LNAIEIYDVGVEDIEPNLWVAFVFDKVGCFSSGLTQAEAESGVIRSIIDYDAWLWRGYEHDEIYFPDVRVNVAEVFLSYPAAEDPEYRINAIFQDDARPLTLSDIQHGWRLLGYTREDLLAVVKDLPAHTLNKTMPNNERFGSIAGILKHVAVAEWWYCDRLGLVEDWSSLPDDPLKALDVSRSNTVLRLPELANDGRITEHVGERWSGRKLLRRALWHERDHTEHIRKLLASDV